MDKLLSISAVVLAVAALSLNALERSPEPIAAGASAPLLSALGSELTARLETVERELEALRMELASQTIRATPERDARAVVESEAEAERTEATTRLVAALESRLSSVESQVTELRAPESPLITGIFGRSSSAIEGDVVAWQLQAMDASSTPDEKLAALRALRFADWNGEDARTHEVVASMIELAESSTDAEVRADVWRQLDEVTDPGLIDPLLRALANDPDPGVREEAAETLAPFLPDPIVEAALRNALANDTNRDVREQAGESLGR